jgi:type I restriction enzyme, S subunit
MSNAWRRVKLGEVAEAQAGFAFKSDRFTNLPVDVPLVKGENVSQGRILWDISKRWPVEEWQQFAKYHLHAGDVVVAMDRPWVPAGLKWAPIRNGDPPALLVQRVARLRSANGGLEQSYLRVLIGSPAFDDYLRPITTGVNVPHISTRQILEFEFDIPPVAAQRRIAAVLSAYDDLVENALARIQVLEEIARVIYREWFVELRFPGHKRVARVDSPLGPIPEGWVVKPLARVAEVNRAQISPREPPLELHYIDISSVSPGRIDWTTTYAFADAPGRARRIVTHGDIIWSCVRPNRRSYALVMHPKPDTIASTGFAVITASAVPYTFLYQALTSEDFVTYLTNHATGAAYPAVSATTFEQAQLVVPPGPLLGGFGELTIPMAEQIHVLQLQVANLRTTRDLLLPRLMSGQLTLPQAEETAAASL